MPRTFPRAPTPYLAAIFAPLSWQFGRPDLFDSYSVGITLLQMAGWLYRLIFLLFYIIHLYTAVCS